MRTQHKVQLALQSQYLVDRLGQVEALLCVGAAGSLSEQLRLGDVVVATTTVEHDYKLRFVEFYNNAGVKGYPTFEVQELR